MFRIGFLVKCRKNFKRDVEWHLLPELSVELEIVIIRHDNLFFRHLAGQQEKA